MINGVGQVVDIKARREYRYPNGADLQPDSETHTKLVGYLREFLHRAHSSAIQRHPQMKSIDDMLRSFIKLSDYEKSVRNMDSREPMPIVLPESFSIRDTLLSYLAGTFLREDPIFRYFGVEPTDKMGAVLLEKTIDWQVRKTKVALALIAFWGSGLSYGRSFVMPHWVVRKGKKVSRRFESKLVERIAGSSILPVAVKRFLNEKRIHEVVRFEGNELVNANPYAVYPDPDIPAGEIQRGRGFAHVDRTNLFNLLEDERTDKFMFNVRYLEDGVTEPMSEFFNQYAEASTNPTEQSSGDDRLVDVFYIEKKIIPADFGIGKGTEPETWEFMLGGDQLLIGARRLEDVHGGFNIVEMATEFDGVTATPISKIETVYGGNVAINFEINSRIANKRMSAQGGWAFDPMMINQEDLMDPSPGMLVRTVESMWGKGMRISDFLEPLNSPDVTVSNIFDIEFMREMMRSGVGVGGKEQGIQRSRGERITAEESRDTRTSAMSRLAFMAYKISLQAHQDIAEIFAYNTQQYMSMDRYVRTIGSLDEVLREEFGIQDDRVKVTPWDVLVDFDVHAGDVLTTGAEDVGSMIQIFQMISGNEALHDKFDLFRMVQVMARAMGFPSVNEFIRKTPQPIKASVVPDEEVEKQVDAGNMVPFDEVFSEQT